MNIGNVFWKQYINNIDTPKDPFWGESVNNAAYDPTINAIQINVGSLTNLGYNIDQPKAIVYAAVVGSTLGHELTHGFDDSGRRYGPNGQYSFQSQRHLF